MIDVKGIAVIYATHTLLLRPALHCPTSVTLAIDVILKHLSKYFFVG